MPGRRPQLQFNRLQRPAPTFAQHILEHARHDLVIEGAHAFGFDFQRTATVLLRSASFRSASIFLANSFPM